MSNRIMRDPFHTAFKHFSELHGMLIESLNYSYNQKNNVACPMSLLLHLRLIMELGFFCDLTDSSDNTALGPLLGSNLKTCSIFPEPCLCFGLSCTDTCLFSCLLQRRYFIIFV